MDEAPKSNDMRHWNEMELRKERDKLETQLDRGELPPVEAGRLRRIRRLLADLDDLKTTRV